MRAVIAGVTLLVSALGGAAPRPREREVVREPVWLGEELPLPLSVRTSQDLKFKSEAERQFLLFNLLAGGKVAYDKNDWATAASKWERLLQLSDLPAEVDEVVRPLAEDARKRAGGTPVAELPPRPTPDVASPPGAPGTAKPPLRKHPNATTVTGAVTGLTGSSGAVVWLKRVDGPTPAPHPSTNKVIYQREKKFVPRLLAVPLGSTVRFRNDDQIFHNVFSLSRPNDFDLGLYKGGLERTQKFTEAGPVNLLCNIHAAMNAFIYVVDSPYYAQTDRKGSFTISNVPPGNYVVHAWQETSSEPTKQPVAVRGEATNVTVSVTNDKPLSAFPPDKAGKPRQPQLGY
jgi:plastocyanin